MATTMIEHLNKLLANELISINQYFLHSRILKDLGYSKLADQQYHQSIDEMKHADTLIQRILFLKGIPNLQQLGKLNIGETPQEMFRSDLNLERNAVQTYQEAIDFAEKQRDFGTRDILKDILMNEEEHVDFLETQLDLIKNLGENLYLASQLT